MLGAPVAELSPEEESSSLSAEAAASADLPDTKAVQRALKELGIYDGKIDGRVGPKTKAAIREFQKSRNLKVDGKVGAATWSLLKGN